jgi:hypothetical protein
LLDRYVRRWREHTRNAGHEEAAAFNPPRVEVEVVLQQLYARCNKTKLSEVQEIVQEWSGKEGQLLEALFTKYEAVL